MPAPRQTTPDWSGAEESLFRALHPGFYKNYCAIAKLIETKTCKQVYDFARQEASHIVEPDNDIDKAPTRKKKKKHR